jgi:hypothetical protein
MDSSHRAWAVALGAPDLSNEKDNSVNPAEGTANSERK